MYACFVIVGVEGEDLELLSLPLARNSYTKFQSKNSGLEIKPNIPVEALSFSDSTVDHKSYTAPFFTFPLVNKPHKQGSKSAEL